MFNQNEILQAVQKGRYEDPSFIKVLRYVKNSRVAIQNYIYGTARHLPPDHLLYKILSAISPSSDLTYDEVYWTCRRNLLNIGAGNGLTHPGGFGNVHKGEFHPNQDEYIVLVAEDIDPAISWEQLTPARYLYHPHTNVNWELTGHGNGVAFIQINLVALVWQYVCWKNTYRESETDRNVWVYLYRYVYYRMLPSYFNLSVYNRHVCAITETPVRKDDRVSVYPIPDIESVMEQHVETVRDRLLTRSVLPFEVLNHITLPFPDPANLNATGVSLPVDVEYRITTLQTRWVYTLVNLQFALYVLRYKNASTEKYLGTFKRELNTFKQTRVLDKMPSHIRTEIKNNLIDPIEAYLR